MARLLLVRHGETVRNADNVYRGRSDVPLSPNGLMQAQSLGRRLSSEGITAIYSSPLVRASETAAAIGRMTGVEPVPDEDLTDLDCGEWEGLSDVEVRAQYPEIRAVWLASPHLVRLPEGESLDDVRARVQRVLDRVRCGEGGVVLVSHRVVHKVAVCALLGLGNERFWDIRMDLAALTEFECSHRRCVLVRHNDTAHLHGTEAGDAAYS